MALPNPDAAPVTIATLPASFMALSALELLGIYSGKEYAMVLRTSKPAGRGADALCRAESARGARRLRAATNGLLRGCRRDSQLRGDAVAKRFARKHGDWTLKVRLCAECATFARVL